MGKIPDGLDPCPDQTVCDLRRFGLGDRKGRDLHLVVHNELLQIVNAADLHSAHHQADEPRVDVEHSLDHEAAFFKVGIIGNGLAQVSGSDDDQVMLPVDA